MKLSFVLILACLVATTVRAETLTVRTAAQNSPPKFVLEGSAMTGLCMDVFKAIERLDRSLKIIRPADFLPMGRIEFMLEQGDIDMFCGLARTQSREAKVEFIGPPLYLTYSMLAARIDDPVEIRNFDDLAKLGNDGLVLVVAKTVHVDVLAQNPGIRFIDSVNNLADNLRLLTLGRGRFVFHSDFALMDEIKRDHLEDRIKLLPTRFLSEGRYLAVSRKATPAIRTKLAAALEKLRKSGELAKLLRNYRPR